MQVLKILKVELSKRWKLIGFYYLFYYTLVFGTNMLASILWNREPAILNGVEIMGCYLIAMLAFSMKT